jgi:O-antigen ligase
MRGRLVIWNVAGELLKERPLLGSGPGTFEIRYGRQIPGAPRAGHNWILEFLVELGGVGLLAFGWMMGRPLVRLYGLRGPPDRATDPWLAAVATGLGASLAAHLAFHLFHSGALAAQAFVVLGLAVAVSRLGEEGTSRP